ncbi:hypothetical protein JRI60_51040 [Archangium violaceum]|uniref:hypothetical protein n=1 Tax=Archangium violaceum TaxID=83451 RepID=UPI0019505ADD|nr:hypothetical protein [Archangium violaceum]QRN97194.1 hypothetical protein JRI60_51040 [Archangium violaceum]
MKSERLSWALGWASLGIGMTELVFPERICRVLGARGRSGLVRGFGLREIACGVGLLLQPHRREWLWARVAGDALDLALLAVSFRLPRANRAWQTAITASVVGATLVDLYAAVKQGAPALRSGAVTRSLGMEVGSSAPAESWRGSGLAEDVGAPPHPSEDGAPDKVKQRMMREAARELGLPDRDERGRPH